QQITNLNKGENISEQEQIINDIEKEIKEVNEELGIKEEKKDDPKKPDKPKKDDFPPRKDDGSNKDSPNNPPRYQKLTPEQE
ncbi:23513_t:CDS:1, partial [Gigaspora margarita]